MRGDRSVRQLLQSSFAALVLLIIGVGAAAVAALVVRRSTPASVTAALAAITAVAGLLATLVAVRTTGQITGPLRDLLAVLGRLGDRLYDARAATDQGPTEIRAVAAAVNFMADEGDRLRGRDGALAGRRGQARALGYRIRQHPVIADAVAEAVAGLPQVLQSEHVLVRMLADGPDDQNLPTVASWHDEHLDGPLARLAACPVTWLDCGDVWCTDYPSTDREPPEQERHAYAAAGGTAVLTVALSSGEDLLGAVTLIRDGGAAAWTPTDLSVADLVAADLGRAVQQARLLERERDLAARVQDLDRTKSEFMSTVSHELRTPLTSIAGYVEMLRDADAGPMSPAQERMLDVIERNARRLRQLIEDLLILSSIEDGTFLTSRRALDAAELVQNAVISVAPAADKASVRLHAELPGPLPVQADPEQLNRVLSNLLSNALKFTPAEGTVTVSAHRAGDELVLVVADTGMGIPRAEQPALFARFFRASNAVRQAIPGAGLGLAIVRTIVDNHGGRIDLQSTEGAGTAVTVRLPAEH